MARDTSQKLAGGHGRIGNATGLGKELGLVYILALITSLGLPKIVPSRVVRRFSVCPPVYNRRFQPKLVTVIEDWNANVAITMVKRRTFRAVVHFPMVK